VHLKDKIYSPEPGQTAVYHVFHGLAHAISKADGLATSCKGLVLASASLQAADTKSSVHTQFCTDSRNSLLVGGK
jgi:hypothetical protein